MIIDNTTSFGEETRSPDFSNEIEVTFNLDIPAGAKKRLVKVYEKAAKDNDNDYLMSELVKNYVKDWNLYETDEKKHEISYQTILDKFPQRLSKWIVEQVTGFISPDKKQN